MLDRIFVYGTLMLHFESSLTHFLRRRSDFVGEGALSGRLYDLGRYPGLVYAPEQKDQTVRGHVFRLHDPAATLKILDEYEGIDPNKPAHDEYRRERCPVAFQEQMLDCWVYLYNLPTDSLPVIADGDYPAFARQNPAHQRFIKSV